MSSEGTFSMSNIVVRPNRSSLSDLNLEKLMFVYYNHLIAADQTLFSDTAGSEKSVGEEDINDLRAVNNLI